MTSPSKVTSGGVETKVVSAATASPIVLVLMYLLDKLPVVHNMDDVIKGALSAIVLGGFTYAAGWLTKHTFRSDLGDTPQTGLPKTGLTR